MSFAARLIHTLEIWRPTFDEDDLDDRGQPLGQGLREARLVQRRRFVFHEAPRGAGGQARDEVREGLPGVGRPQEKRFEDVAQGGELLLHLLGGGGGRGHQAEHE